MSAGCCSSLCSAHKPISPRFRRALWIALVVNAAMFFVEIAGGVVSGSVALWADAVDFAGDAANYGVSLAALSLGLVWQSRVALIKGGSMAVFGLVVALKSAWALLEGVPPEPVTMGVIGALALVANVGVAVLLYAYRDGDANRRAVWLCSRNDAIGNLFVLLAAGGVFGTGLGWPDSMVALGMGLLAVSSGVAVIRLARAELASVGTVASAR